MDDYMDITSERDVSDAVMEQSESCAALKESDIPVYNDIPDNTIIFRSMDGSAYLIDKTAIDWELSALNEYAIESNLFAVQQTLQKLMMLNQNDITPEDTDFALTAVKDIVVGSGCTPKYTLTYPNADDYVLAQLYCIDAMQLCNLILKEIAIFKTNKSIMDCLNFITQEDVTHEDQIPEDIKSVPGWDKQNLRECNAEGGSA